MCEHHVYVVEGCLATYSANLPAIFRGLADYVDRVLHGARVDSLPIEQPREFEFLINQNTAEMLGLAGFQRPPGFPATEYSSGSGAPRTLRRSLLRPRDAQLSGQRTQSVSGRVSYALRSSSSRMRRSRSRGLVTCPS